jgi:hypothetical protein
MLALLFLLMATLPSPGPTVMANSTGPEVVAAGMTASNVAATGTRFSGVAQVSTATTVATDVRHVETAPAPLLTGLAKNRPSIWGSRGFYVLLGLTYVTLLGLFIKQIINISVSSSDNG